MIKDRLELRGCLSAAALLQISLPAQVLRPELAGNLVFLRRVEQLNYLGWISSIQFQLRSGCRDRYCVEQSILRKCFGYFIHVGLGRDRMPASSERVRGSNQVGLLA